MVIMKKVSAFTFACLLPMLCASGCTQTQPGAGTQQTTAGTDISSEALQADPLQLDTGSAIEGEAALSLRHNGKTFWLATSESAGLLLQTPQGSRHSLRQSVELLDIRPQVSIDDQVQPLGISFDQNKGELFMFTVDYRQGQLRELAILNTGPIEPEGLCLQQTPQGHVFAFLLDGAGGVLHYLLVDGERRQLAPVEIRRFNATPGSVACAVDDDRERLYILEEGFGIWSYSAGAETDPDRLPFQLIKPYGKYLDSVSGLAIHNGLLATLDSDNARSLIFDTHQSRLIRAITFSGVTAPESVTLTDSAKPDHLQLTLYDAGQDNYRTGDFFLEQPSRMQVKNLPEVQALVETEPMGKFGDVADDPAIWVNEADPDNSRILGTNKKSGLHVYDLHGKELQYFPTGRLNNVDLRSGVAMGDQSVAIAAASNRNDNSIALFVIDHTGQVTAHPGIPTGLVEVYGLCTYRDKSGRFFVFVNDKDGTFQQWQVSYDAASGFTGSLVRSFATESQPEGCVVNDVTGSKDQLFIGEEDKGIWVTSANPESVARLQSVIKVSEFDADSPLVADVEGLAIFYGNNRNYLVVSSQGNDSYLLFDTEPPYAYAGGFRIAMSVAQGIDGASETDGLDVVAQGLPAPFAEGMLVVQDGRNVMPQQGQNFKYVPWQQIREALSLAP